jgi:hypothetical protein
MKLVCHSKISELFFKAFLSHRYGSRCLKSRIFENEYNLIKHEILIDDGKLLMDPFYELDENSTLNKVYKLKTKKMIMEELSVDDIILYFFLPNSNNLFFYQNQD